MTNEIREEKDVLLKRFVAVSARLVEVPEVLLLAERLPVPQVEEPLQGRQVEQLQKRTS